MKKRRSVLGIVFALVFCVLLFAGCGNGENPEEASPTPEPIQTTATDAAPTPEPTPAVVEEPEASMAPLVPVEEDGAAGEDADSGESSDGESSSDGSGDSDSSESSSSGVLKIEMENDRVEKLQERLKELGYLDKVTGYFGTDTEAAVKEFQENNGLEADGIVGSGTQKVLDSDDAKKAS